MAEHLTFVTMAHVGDHGGADDEQAGEQTIAQRPGDEQRAAQRGQGMANGAIAQSRNGALGMLSTANQAVNAPTTVRIAA